MYIWSALLCSLSLIRKITYSNLEHSGRQEGYGAINSHKRGIHGVPQQTLKGQAAQQQTQTRYTY
jgi:hypothetical protein